MNNQTPTFHLVCSTVAMTLALAIWSPVQAQAAQAADGKATMTDGGMMVRCQEMKEKKEKMTAETKAQDAEITAQVAKLNNAPDSEKLGLMVALVSHMAEQRISMDAQRDKMDGEMMQHMMQHMQMGADSMAQCPMMMGMADMDAKADGTHGAHHEEQK